MLWRKTVTEMSQLSYIFVDHTWSHSVNKAQLWSTGSEPLLCSSHCHRIRCLSQSPLQQCPTSPFCPRGLWSAGYLWYCASPSHWPVPRARCQHYTACHCCDWSSGCRCPLSSCCGHCWPQSLTALHRQSGSQGRRRRRYCRQSWSDSPVPCCLRPHRVKSLNLRPGWEIQYVQSHWRLSFSGCHWCWSPAAAGETDSSAFLYSPPG